MCPKRLLGSLCLLTISMISPNDDKRKVLEMINCGMPSKETIDGDKDGSRPARKIGH